MTGLIVTSLVLAFLAFLVRLRAPDFLVRLIARIFARLGIHVEHNQQIAVIAAGDFFLFAAVALCIGSYFVGQTATIDGMIALDMALSALGVGLLVSWFVAKFAHEPATPERSSEIRSLPTEVHD